MNNILHIDVMVQGGKKFYCTIPYPYNPIFKFDFEDLAKFVYEKRPTLKYRNDVVLVCDDINNSRL